MTQMIPKINTSFTSNNYYVYRLVKQPLIILELTLFNKLLIARMILNLPKVWFLEKSLQLYIIMLEGNNPNLINVSNLVVLHV